MRLATFLSMALSVALFTSVAHAGSAYSIALEPDAVAPPGGLAEVAVILDSSAGGQLQGWSWGVCTVDPAIAAVTDVVPGATTAALNGGAGPDFFQINLLPDGWTEGTVISFLGLETLPPGGGYEMTIASYTLTGGGGCETSTTVYFCDTLGVPPVAVVVMSGGTSIPPAAEDIAMLTVCGDGGDFLFIAPNQSAYYDLEDGTGSATANVSIQQEPGGFGLPFPADTQGFSMGLGHDSALLNVVGIAPTGELATINGGAGPDFFGDNLLSNGWTAGVVYAFLGGVFIQFDVAKEVIAADYETVPAGLIGDLDGEIMPLTWTGALGVPPVANVVVVGGSSYPTQTVDGSITLITNGGGPFVRGDCNDDGIVDIADGVWNINQLFLGGPSAPCFAHACDTNDDGLVDSSDSVYIWNYQFLGGPPPSAPFPDCGDFASGAECDSSCP